MSSDLLEDVTDPRGNSISLEMGASGLAVFGILEDDSDTSVDFHLTPDEDGLRLAERIEGGLRAWREQVAHLRSCEQGDSTE